MQHSPRSHLCGLCHQFACDIIRSEFNFDSPRTHLSARWIRIDEWHGFAFEHHENVAELDASGTAGCSLCRILLADFQERDCNGKLWLYPDFRYSIKFRVAFGDKPDYLGDCRIDDRERFNWASGLGGQPQLYYRVGLLRPWGASLDYRPGLTIREEAAVDKMTTEVERRDEPVWERAIPNRVISEDALATARCWIRDCTSKHDHCIKGERNNAMPTRVIDVGTIGKPEVKLYVPSNQERGAYVALSHCWGGDIPSKLLESNLAAYQQPLPGGFPLDQLPQNFLDAIRLTRELGFRFVWIDALCIIQDSVADWQREASRMTAAYSSAALTISILDAKASTEGFLGPRGTGQAIISSELAISKELRTPAEALVVCPLSHRGWCMQERLLSPALLHIGYDQMYWECWTGVCSETGGPASFTAAVGHCPARRGQSVALFNKLRPRVFGGIGQSSSEDWYHLVEEFTSRKLTMVTDKLPAVAGAARYLRNMGLGRGKYLAGLWEDDLMRACFWSARVVYPFSSRQPGYDECESLSRPADTNTLMSRIPTWSWASVDGPVEFQHMSKNSEESSTGLAEWPDVLRLLKVDVEVCNSNSQVHIEDDFLGNQLRSSLRDMDDRAPLSWAAGNGRVAVVQRLLSGCQVINLLFNHDRTLQATEPVLVAALEKLNDYATETLTLLLQRDGGLGVTSAMLKAAKKSKIMRVLINHKSICRITLDILSGVRKDKTHISADRYKRLMLLIEHETSLPITKSVMLTVLSVKTYDEEAPSLVKLLLQRNPELEVTATILQAVKKPDDMKPLLKHTPGLKITQGILETAIPRNNSYSCYSSMIIPLECL
ncbi:HET-domain-containing protein [Thozetella sp. PMI_491]|nr:HET-domain-containing protein [Thozetella sp. PMI_491]